MKLLVVSDVHGDLDALERAVDAEADADAVIFLGDGLREAEDLQDMRPELKIYSVRGNCDYASFAPPDGLAAFGGVLFYYTHGNLYSRSKISRNYWLFEPKCRNNAELTYILLPRIAIY